MRLIDLDEFLLQNCIDRMDGKSCEECKYHVLEVSCERLMEQPTIDPVNLPSAKDIDVPNTDLSEYSDRLWKAAYERGYREALELLDSLPFEQTEIVRCKDCKWCEDADGLMCKNPASWVVATDDDFGCVCAKRRAVKEDENRKSDRKN